MARADLKKRLDEVAATLGSPVIMGMWAHEDGRPTYHHLAARNMSLESWFKTGKLPRNVQFVAVMHETESQRLWMPDPADEPEGSFIPTAEDLQVNWEPFLENLHRDALKQLHKMPQADVYSFFDGQLQGFHGPLPPNDQRRELYPHG